MSNLIAYLGAVMPWRSQYAEQDRTVDPEDHPSTYDTPEQIDECINCPFTTCINCHDKKMRREQPYRAEIIRMLQEGASVYECASLYGVSTRTVRNYKVHLKGGGEL